MGSHVTAHGGDAQNEIAQVTALVARAGLRLPADEIEDLIAAYRSDRAGFERLRREVAAGEVRSRSRFS